MELQGDQTRGSVLALPRAVVIDMPRRDRCETSDPSSRLTTNIKIKYLNHNKSNCKINQEWRGVSVTGRLSLEIAKHSVYLVIEIIKA